MRALKSPKKSAQKSGSRHGARRPARPVGFGEAQAANPLELNFWLNGPRYDGNVAPCEAALPTIISQFQEKESTFWNSSLAITAYGNVHETALPALAVRQHSAPLLHRPGDGQRRQEFARCTSRSSRTAALPASARASNGAWSGSTATGPSIRPARPPGPDSAAGPVAGFGSTLHFVLEMFSSPARLPPGLV